MKTPFDDQTFDFIHENCLEKLIPDPNHNNDIIPWTVAFLIKLMRRMQALEIPKEFMPGMILLYFKLCRGLEILPVPLL